MSTMRENIEKAVVSIAATIYRHPFKALLLLLALVAAPISQAPHIARDGSIEGFLTHDDPDLLNYNAFRRQFGQDGEIIIAISPPEIFARPFLEKLIRFHQDLAQSVPYIEDITSMYNARDSRGGESYFQVEDLLDHLPETSEEMAALKQRVMSNNVYENLLVSKDEKITTITIKPNRYSPKQEEEYDVIDQFMDDVNASYVERQKNRTDFLTPDELGEMVSAVRKVTMNYRSPDFQVAISGAPVASNEIVRLMTIDMPTYTRICLLAIFTMLLLVTRKLGFVLLPVGVILLTLLTTFGLMSLTGTALKPPTQVILSIIIVASLCDTLHLLTVFYQRLKRGDDKEAAIRFAVQHCSTALLFTSLTTAMGLLAFMSSPLAPIIDLGMFGAVAVILAMVYTLTIIVIAVRLFPFRHRMRTFGWRKGSQKPEQVHEHAQLERGLIRIALFSHRNPKTVITGVALLALIFATGFYGLEFSHNSLKWLPEDNQVRVDTETIDRSLQGSISLEVVVDSGTEFGIQDKTLLSGVDELTREIHTLEQSDLVIGKAIAATDILREVNKTVHGSRPEYYKIPDQNMISKEFLLFENSGSDDLTYYADTLYSKARYTVRIPWLEATQYRQFIAGTKKLFDMKLADAATVIPTGLMALLAKTSAGVMHSMAYSYLYSGITIFLIMVWINGGLRQGLVSMVPNTLPIFMALGMMGFARLPLDTFSIMVGSIALGLIVDDTIHFFYNFRKHYAVSGDVPAAIEQTVALTGRPILLTSFVLMIGFGTYMLASMNNVASFGLTMLVVVLLALLADLLISPALVTLANPIRSAVSNDTTELELEVKKVASQ